MLCALNGTSAWVAYPWAAAGFVIFVLENFALRSEKWGSWGRRRGSLRRRIFSLFTNENEKWIPCSRRRKPLRVTFLFIYLFFVLKELFLMLKTLVGIHIFDCLRDNLLFCFSILFFIFDWNAKPNVKKLKWVFVFFGILMDNWSFFFQFIYVLSGTLNFVGPKCWKLKWVFVLLTVWWILNDCMSYLLFCDWDTEVFFELDPLERLITFLFVCYLVVFMMKCVCLKFGKCWKYHSISIITSASVSMFIFTIVLLTCYFSLS